MAKKCIVQINGAISDICEAEDVFDIYEGADATMIWVDAPDDVTPSMRMINGEFVEQKVAKGKESKEFLKNLGYTYINESNNDESSWHLFVIKIGNRDELHQKLKEKGISTSVHFIPIHKHPYYKNRFSFDNEKYPVANLVFEQSLSLPIYPGLGESEVEYIIKYVLEYAEDIN